MDTWYRGSTPVNWFKTSIDLTGAKVYITYVQNGKVILEKTNEDIEIASDHVSVQLSQEDTLKFKDGRIVKMQFRYIFPDGSADASTIAEARVGKILKEGVIKYES